jgi:DnaB-like helicase C terminal domain
LNIFQRATMLNPDMKILFLSLEQNSGDWFERARRIWNFYNQDCERGKVHEETINYWEPRMRLVEKSRPSEEEFNQALDDYEAEMGGTPDLVAVDYLGYWAQGFKAKDRYEKVTDAVMALKQLAGDRKVPIISPHQVNRGAEFGAELQIDQARDSGAVEETADFAIGMWSPDTMKGVGTPGSEVRPNGQLVLRVGKSRHGGKGKEMRLQFGQLTLVFVPEDEDRHVAMLKNELGWAENPKNTWEHAIEAHRMGTPLTLGM